MPNKMVIPGERIAVGKEPESTDDTDSLESYPDTASIGYPDISSPDILSSDSRMSSPGPSTIILPPSPLHL